MPNTSNILNDGPTSSRVCGTVRACLLCALAMLCNVASSPVRAAVDDPLPWGKPVIDIRIESDANLKIRDFADQITQKEREPLEESKVDESLKNLYATGRFRDLRADVEEQRTGVVLVFVGRAEYFIGLVRVSGAPKGMEPEVLASATRLRLGTRYNDDELKQARARLSAALAQNGFYSPSVTAKIQKFSTQEVDIDFLIEGGVPARLNKIEFRGQTAVPQSRLVALARWRPGIQLTSNRLERGLSRLRRFYTKHKRLQAAVSVRSRTPDLAHNTETLVVDIQAGPVVHVLVRGVRIYSYQLRRLIPVFTEGQADELSLAQGQRNLQDYLERRGYFSSAVHWKRQLSSDGQKLDITYFVTLGSHSELVGLEFTGNRHVPESELDSVLQIQPDDFPRVRGLFSRQLLAADVAAVTSLYQSRGFLEVKVTTRMNDHYEGEPNRLFVSFEIEEGPQTTVDHLVIRGVDPRTQSDLEAQLFAKPGQPYSPQRVKTDHDTILTYLGNRGHNHADVTWRSTSSSSPHKVNLEYDIQAGIQERIQRIVLMGNDHTRSGVIDHALTLRTGEALREGDMLESQRRLYDLGLFSQVQIAHQDPEIEGSERTVLVDVQEARRWTVAYGGGLDVQRLAQASNPRGQYKASPRVALEVTRLNVWGRPQTFSIRGRYSNLEKEGAGSYLIPHFLNHQNLNFRINALADQTRDVATFNARREEGSVSLERHSSPATYLLLRYTYRRVSVNNLHVQPASVPLLSQPARVALMQGTYINDHRDNPADASRGSYSVLDLGVASARLGSQSNFLRLSGQNSTYYQIRPNLIFARDTRLGLESPVGGLMRVVLPNGQVAFTHDIPLPERFFMGGSESHRAFSTNQAGPRDPVTGLPIGGNALFLNSLELRFRFFDNKYGLVLFHDAGNVYSSIRLMRLLKFTQGSPANFDYTVHAAGIGFRYQTPIGPLRFDVGYALNPPRYQVQASNAAVEVQRLPRAQFLLSVGQSF